MGKVERRTGWKEKKVGKLFEDLLESDTSQFIWIGPKFR